MSKKQSVAKFFKNFAEALRVSSTTKKNFFLILEPLLKSDPARLTQYEVSFKIFDTQIIPKVRFLNIDADTCSCKSQQNFLNKVELFDRVLKGRSANQSIPAILESLREISLWPMDLYLGSDIKDNNFVFAFWLIFGGVKRGSAPVFWPYDFKKIMNIFFRNLKLKPPKFLKNKILNFGLDIEKRDVKYKIYYLCPGKKITRAGFNKIADALNRELKNFKYFYFFSEMYNKDGKLIKKKLFLEFLEDICNTNEDLSLDILERLLAIKLIKFNKNKIQKILAKIGGRLSLISLEKNGTLTFYLRPF